MRINFLVSILTLLPLCVGGQKNHFFLKKVNLVKRTVLTKTAYGSGGSDRARYGKPRFHGLMESKVTSIGTGAA